jgi:peptidoglycan LD-endopeptidase LytH
MKSKAIPSRKYHPVVNLPKTYNVLDLSQGIPAESKSLSPYSIGRYAEKRTGIYDQEIFGGIRNIHVGIDIGAPVGEPVYAFADGEIFKLGDNRAAGDYGPTIITRHNLEGVILFALYGHLSRKSLEGKSLGEKFLAGTNLGWLGSEIENGGWPPHVHFQLSLREPKGADFPGVVSEQDLPLALEIYPDPRLILGNLY